MLEKKIAYLVVVLLPSFFLLPTVLMLARRSKSNYSSLWVCNLLLVSSQIVKKININIKKPTF